METLKFTRDHLWVRLDGTYATIGLSDTGQAELGTISAIQLPEVGDMLERGEAFGEIESRRTVSDLLVPVNGTVTAINTDLEDNPSLVNEDPHHDGWLIEVDLSNDAELEDLIDPDEYETIVSDGS